MGGLVSSDSEVAWGVGGCAAWVGQSMMWGG